MFKQLRPLCLASSSPRRQEYLQRYGLAFEGFHPEVNEVQQANEPVEAYVLRVVKEKINVARAGFGESVILAGDTVVLHQKNILGKPENENHAYLMLKQLSGQQHEVYSAFAILDAVSNDYFADVCRTKVQFRPLSSVCIQAYIKTGEPLDKAGAYSIQGLGSMLIESIHGSYNNVVGFPVEQILPYLLQKGWIAFV